jgi:hypothetical protein
MVLNVKSVGWKLSVMVMLLVVCDCVAVVVRTRLNVMAKIASVLAILIGDTPFTLNLYSGAFLFIFIWGVDENILGFGGFYRLVWEVLVQLRFGVEKWGEWCV